MKALATGQTEMEKGEHTNPGAAERTVQWPDNWRAATYCTGKRRDQIHLRPQCDLRPRKRPLRLLPVGFECLSFQLSRASRGDVVIRTSYSLDLPAVGAEAVSVDSVTEIARARGRVQSRLVSCLN